MDMPKNWFNFDNYVQAFVASNMAVAFRNSIIVVVVVLVVTTIIGTMLAYVLSRFQFPGNGLIRGMFMPLRHCFRASPCKSRCTR